MNYRCSNEIIGWCLSTLTALTLPLLVLEGLSAILSYLPANVLPTTTARRTTTRHILDMPAEQ